LDIDSPVLKRFDQADAEGLSDTVALLNRYNRWSD
jgi:putative methionine-R-sulfoxide reductase with GAF domain